MHTVKRIVTVNTKGILKANSAGTATVTVTSKANSKIKAKCRITVNSPVGKKPSATCKIVVEEERVAEDEAVVTKEPGEPTVTEKPAEPTAGGQQVLPAGIKLNKTEITLDYGMSTTLRATILPEEAADTTITWTSSNEEVASVTEGAVFGLSEGDAVITVTTVNGLQADCKVYVNAPTGSLVPADSVSLSETEATINARCWLGLVLTISPATAEHQTILVSSSNSNVAYAVDQGYNSKGERIIGVVGGFPGVSYVTACVGGKTVNNLSM